MTPEQVKATFARKGITYAEFCRAHHIKTNTLSTILNGMRRGSRGEGHRAAVLLGLKSETEGQPPRIHLEPVLAMRKQANRT